MRAGELRTVISIWRATTVINEYGERSGLPQCVGQWRAAKDVQDSRRTLSRGEVWYPRAAVFRVRLGCPVIEGDQLREGTHVWDVVSVSEDRVQEKCITINTELHDE